MNLHWGLGAPFWVFIACYLTALSAVGYYSYTRTEGEADFLIANREIGPFVGAATLSASQMSAGTFVGVIGIHYLIGAGFIWSWAGLWAGWIVALVLVAPQIRRFGRMTVPDFIAVRYGNDGTNGEYTRVLSALLLITIYTVYLTAQITAGGLILQFLFGIPETISFVVVIVVATLYTVAGGMRASVLTDSLQATIMGATVIIAVPVVLQHTGGVDGLNALLGSLDPSLVTLTPDTMDVLGFMLAFGLAKAVAPRDITRAYAMRDEQTVRKAITIAIAFQVTVAVSIALLGLSLRVLFPELSVPDFGIAVLSLNVLGPILGSLVIVAVISALLSTIDSVLLISGAGIAHDIYGEIINPDATDRRKVAVNRVSIIVLGIVPLGLTLNNELVGGLVELIVILQSSMMGASFFVPFVLGLHWRRANTAGGIAGMLGGFFTVIVWHVGTEVIPVLPAFLTTPVGDPVIPGVLVSFVVFVSASLATAPPGVDTLKPFFNTGQGSEGQSEE